MKTICIIGAGPAGLTAASILSKNEKIKVLVVEFGKDLGNRQHNLSDDLGVGAGGAGLYSDGKFSYFPSGSNLYKFYDPNILRKGHTWLESLLEQVDIPSAPLPESLDISNTIHDFTVKEYLSTYGSLEQRRRLIGWIIACTLFAIKKQQTQFMRAG